MLEADNLKFCRQQQCLFDNIHFCLMPHTILFIEGDNGTGKTSLLKILAGILLPTTGTVRYQQQLISKDPHFLDTLHYVGHDNGLKLNLTAYENLKLICELNLCKPVIEIESLLQSFNLTKHSHQLVAKLSAGQKRKLGLARLFLIPKALWLLDEPLTALDVQTQQLFRQHLAMHVTQGGMAVITSHQALTWQGQSQTIRLAPC